MRCGEQQIRNKLYHSSWFWNCKKQYIFELVQFGNFHFRSNHDLISHLMVYLESNVKFELRWSWGIKNLLYKHETQNRTKKLKELRNSNDINLTGANKACSQNALFYKGIELYNYLPNDIKNSKTISKLKNLSKVNIDTVWKDRKVLDYISIRCYIG